MHGAWQGANAWGTVPVNGHVGEAASAAFWKLHCFPWASTQGLAMSCNDPLRKGAAVLCCFSLENGLQFGSCTVSSTGTFSQLCIPQSFASESVEPYCGRAGGIGKNKSTLSCYVRRAVWVSNQESWGLRVFPLTGDHVALAPGTEKQ